MSKAQSRYVDEYDGQGRFIKRTVNVDFDVQFMHLADGTDGEKRICGASKGHWCNDLGQTTCPDCLERVGWSHERISAACAERREMDRLMANYQANGPTGHNPPWGESCNPHLIDAARCKSCGGTADDPVAAMDASR